MSSKKGDAAAAEDGGAGGIGDGGHAILAAAALGADKVWWGRSFAGSDRCIHPPNHHPVSIFKLQFIRTRTGAWSC